MLAGGYGICGGMSEMRKITAFMPVELLERGQRVTGMGVSETLREALRRMLRAEAYEKLRSMRGTMDLEADGCTLADLREDGPDPWERL